ncbi:carbohydrate ABC transporter permease [Clavibacter tessellarius]|uniref:Sugar ABC transporter permease n=1 Tax=Clavibacter tessellarius TaxID=31965 RepID=A0A154UZP7_9MICO|nr:carbohydrate ABC transporter permease [Clavibacter michiganensis]KZC94610.1 sugar ABC transporter permease [Clavibacter michiganensis subsp. tessellarius]
MTTTASAPAAAPVVADAATGTPPRRPRRRTDRGRRARAILYLVLAAALCVWLIPFVWMALGSVKTQGEILQRPPTWWPADPVADNFAQWFGPLHFGTFFSNSLVVALITVLGNLVFCSMVGYALAKMEFPGKRLLFLTVMVTLMVPGVVTFVPLFVMVSGLGLVNTYAALILPFITAPIGVFLMRQFMLGIPEALIEAARLDGAGEFRIFARIVMPLCGPPLATLGILTFLASWNNFLWPLVAAQSEQMYTLPIALSLYSTGQNATDYGLLLAGSVLVIAPILALFVVLQRHFIQGVATAGLK